MAVRLRAGSVGAEYYHGHRRGEAERVMDVPVRHGARELLTSSNNGGS